MDLGFDRKANSLPRESALAIHKFHRHQIMKGKTKNNGPINWPGRDLSKEYPSNNKYFNQIRDPKIAAAIQATHQMLAESLDMDLDPNADIRSGYRTNQTVSYNEISGLVGSGNNGLIDINQAFMLI